jgi:hypothetical protein
VKISNAKWDNRDHTVIRLTIVVEKSDPWPFTNLPTGRQEFGAAQNDKHNHGRELFFRALLGEFGQILEWGV